MDGWYHMHPLDDSLTLARQLARTAAAVATGLALALGGVNAHAKAKAARHVSKPVPVAASASAPAPATASEALKAAANRYHGKFTAACLSLADGLFAQDRVDLQPTGARVNARYHKALFTDPNCLPSSLMVTLHLPPVTWDLEGTTTIDGTAVDTVKVTLSAGLITASVVQEAAVRQTAEQIIVKVGQEELPISRQAEGSVDKDIRLLDKDTLSFGDPEKTNEQGHPTALSQVPFIRNLTPSSP